MKLLYENLLSRLMDSGLSRKEAEHLFILAVEDVVVAMDDKMLENDENFLMLMMTNKEKSLLS